MFAVICDKCGKIPKSWFDASGYYRIDFHARSEPLKGRADVSAHLCPECGQKMIEEMEQLNKKEDDGSEQTDHHWEPHA